MLKRWRYWAIVVAAWLFGALIAQMGGGYARNEYGRIGPFVFLLLVFGVYGIIFAILKSDGMEGSISEKLRPWFVKHFSEVIKNNENDSNGN